MKKTIFALMTLVFFTLSAQAYNYNSAMPSNTWGGNVSIRPTAATANGSTELYNNMVQASYYNRYNDSYYGRHKPPQSPRKQRIHGSINNKYH